MMHWRRSTWTAGTAVLPDPCPDGGGYTPTLTPGEEFSVCVTVTVRIPLLPEFIDAKTATG